MLMCLKIWMNRTLLGNFKSSEQNQEETGTYMEIIPRGKKIEKFSKNCPKEDTTYQSPEEDINNPYMS